MPDLEAGCSLADGCPPAALAAFKAKHPGAMVVAYINCTAEVKALCDYIVHVVERREDRRQLPARAGAALRPGQEPRRATSRRSSNRPMILWQGSCIVHETFSERKLVRLKERHPGAEVIAHPECEEPVLAHADYIGSTTALLKRVRRAPRTEFIVATEPGIFHEMQKAAPRKTLIAAPSTRLRDDRRLQRVPVHEEEHAREGARLAAAPDPAGRRAGAAALAGAAPMLRMLELSRAKAA